MARVSRKKNKTQWTHFFVCRAADVPRRRFRTGSVSATGICFPFFFLSVVFFFKKKKQQKWHGFDETALCRHLLQLPTQVFTSGDVGADALDFLLLKSSRRVRKEMS